MGNVGGLDDPAGGVADEVANGRFGVRDAQDLRDDQRVLQHPNTATAIKFPTSAYDSTASNTGDYTLSTGGSNELEGPRRPTPDW